MSKVILVIGKQASGKTTLIKKLIAEKEYNGFSATIETNDPTEIIECLNDGMNECYFIESNTITYDALIDHYTEKIIFHENFIDGYEMRSDYKYITFFYDIPF